MEWREGSPGREGFCVEGRGGDKAEAENSFEGLLQQSR